MTQARIPPALFRFLRDLKDNNDRTWFQENKERYDRDARGPALEFVAAFGPHLEKISTHFVADPRPVGGSMFRIHRDTRFSKDKSPYKTAIGLHFRHEEARNAHAPGFYLHLEPRQCFVGMGLWRPETAVARQIREAILADPAAWKRAAHAKRFRDTFELSGDSLKRPPAGVDADHPLVEDLKRKDFIAVRELSQGDVTAKDFLPEFARLCRTGRPLMDFLCDVLQVAC